MNCGYFDVPNREYVITDPRTPVKWINYIGTRQFGGFVDHTGGALICKDDPTFNRITKYIQQMPASDFKGETLYLRINLTPQPPSLKRRSLSPGKGEHSALSSLQPSSPHFPNMEGRPPGLSSHQPSSPSFPVREREPLGLSSLQPSSPPLPDREGGPSELSPLQPSSPPLPNMEGRPPGLSSHQPSSPPLPIREGGPGGVGPPPPSPPYLLFSPFFVPSLDPYQRFECRIGLGYTRLITEFYDLRTQATIFVPLGGACELRDIQITNIGRVPLRVDAIPLVEYTHPDALKQFTNADWVPQTMQSRAVSDGEYTILLQYPFMHRDTQVNYLTSNLSASSFETDRRTFLGENEYGTFRAPLSLLRPELSNTQARRGDNIAALLHPLGELQPGETRRLITQLGQARDLESAHSDIQRYRDPQVVEAELEKLRAFWDEYLSALQVETPDASMNAMLNVYNPRQCYVTKTWSRYLSYYQLGLGSRGIGIRDSSQDVLSVMASVPEEGREFLLTLLSFQKRDGSAVHQFNPLTMEGSAGDSMEMEDRPHYYSDDHLWMVLGASAYLKETGDLAFLGEVVPFYDKDKNGRPLESGSVLEHLRRGLAFTRQDVGRHGLPLLGFADWNDTVNLPAGAESLFTANLYGKALLEMIALYEHLGDVDALNEARAAYDEMRSRVESAAWDGEWYVRYFDAEGEPLGSSRNIYGQIDLTGQVWPVISGFASPERARMAMDSVYRRLNTRYGIKLSTPGFDGYDPKYGGVTTFPPGAKENGGIFLHPNPWAVIAETLLGRGDRAYEYYAQINPASRNDQIEIYECEPYVYPQNILGDEHPQFGLARNSWLSGTASWCYQAATQWILGLRPEYAGLRIDPCIPSSWSGFSAVRRFRGRRLHITVHNPQRVCKGVVRMRIDGEAVKGSLIPPDLPGAEHRVEVWLGA